MASSLILRKADERIKTDRRDTMMHGYRVGGEKRLYVRYQKLLNAGKIKQQVTTAVDREITGFIWAIACKVSGKAHASEATQ